MVCDVLFLSWTHVSGHWSCVIRLRLPYYCIFVCFYDSWRNQCMYVYVCTRVTVKPKPIPYSFIHSFITSSSAVAKRPLDASCLSVVSFNSTKRRVVFYCYSRRLQIYHCVQLNALFCCLWRNVEASCHKHFVVFSGNQHCRLLPMLSTGDRVYNT